MLRQHSLKEQASKLEFDVFVVDQLIHQVLYDVGTTMMLETCHCYFRQIRHVSAAVLSIHVNRQFDSQGTVCVFSDIVKAQITPVDKRFQAGRLEQNFIHLI